jgi:hypothetical protein
MPNQPHHQTLAKLHVRWAALAEDPNCNPDDHSLHYYRAATDDLNRLLAGVRVQGWLDRIEQIEAFIQTKNSLPRSAPSRKRSGSDVEAMGDFLQYQRRATSITAYQKERVSLLPMFEWEPRDARFDDRLNAYLEYVELTGRAPRLRGPDPVERSLARWMRHCRDQNSAGRLPQWQLVALQAAAPPLTKPLSQPPTTITATPITTAATATATIRPVDTISGIERQQLSTLRTMEQNPTPRDPIQFTFYIQVNTTITDSDLLRSAAVAHVHSVLFSAEEDKKEVLDEVTTSTLGAISELIFIDEERLEDAGVNIDWVYFTKEPTFDD